MSVTLPADEALGELAKATRLALGAHGLLAEHEDGFVEREVQQQLAQAVAQAIDDRATLVAEAGTGVGKTFAYLVPVLLSQRRAIVSTATKSLQDQLFLRDIPRLRDALQLPVSVALLKGRSSYLCLHRMKQARESATLPDRWAELDRLADLRVRFLDETGAFFDAKPYPTTAYRDTTPLMHEIRRDGLDL